MLQRLEAAERTAELLAHLEVFDGHVQARRHRADRLGGERHDREVRDAFEDIDRAAGLSDRVLRAHAYAVEADVRRAHAIHRAVAPARYTRRARIDEPQADAVAIGALAVHARAHQQLIGEVVARLRLGMRERDDRVAGRDPRYPLRALAGRRAGAQRRTGDHDGRQI